MTNRKREWAESGSALKSGQAEAKVPEIILKTKHMPRLLCQLVRRLSRSHIVQGHSKHP